MSSLFLIQAQIAGWKHYTTRNHLLSIIYEPLTLVPEPDNQYDSYALKIMREGEHLGYVPRPANQVLTQLLAAGAPLSASCPTFAEFKVEMGTDPEPTPETGFDQDSDYDPSND